MNFFVNPLQFSAKNGKILSMSIKTALIGKKPTHKPLMQKCFDVIAIESESVYPHALSGVLFITPPR